MVDNLIWAGTTLAGLSVLCWTALRGWRGWLDYRRFAVAAQNGRTEASDPEPGVRIELAAVKERLRKLEAIAQGVDL